MATPSIHGLDYAIFIVMIVVTLGIGLFNGCTGGKQKTLEEYFVGNRQLRVFPVILSMVASLYSSVIIVGFPAEVYTRGGQYWLYAVGVTLGAFGAAGIFVPVFHPLKLTSMNHYLWDRFKSRFVVVIGTFIQVLTAILHSAIAFFGPAATLAVVTPIPIWASIVIGAIITIIYTTIGGIRGVVWTDVLQALMMLASILAVCIQSIRKVGSFQEVWEINSEWDRLDFLNFDPDPRVRLTFWSLIIGVGYHNLNRYGNSQVTVQRFCALPTIKKSFISVLGLIPVIVLIISLTSISGLGMFAFYTKLGCDPFKAKQIRNINQLVSRFVLDELNYPGIPGILLAGLIAASLSTASSYINSASAVTWDDILKMIWPNLCERKAIIVTKCLVIIYGLISMGLAFLVERVGGTIIQFIITFSSATGGPTTAMFLLGIFCPFVNWQGAVASILGGCTFGLWVGFGAYTINRQSDVLDSTIANCSSHVQPMIMMNTTLLTMPSEHNISYLHDFYSISYLWLSMFSGLVGLVIGLLVTFLLRIIFKTESNHVEARLLHPLIRRCCKSTEEFRDQNSKEGIDNTGMVSTTL